MAALNAAQNFYELPGNEPDNINGNDYSVPHRPPPAIPSVPYHSTVPAESATSVTPRGRQRGGSFGQLFRFNNRSASHSRSQSQQQIPTYNSAPTPTTTTTTTTTSNNHNQHPADVVPPIPPAAGAAAAPNRPAPPAPSSIAASSEDKSRKRSLSAVRKITVEGRTMLRKSSRKAREEAERQELERKRKLSAQAPTLELLHEPGLPGIGSFGGDNYTSPSSTTLSNNNFSTSGPLASSSNQPVNFSRSSGFAMPASSSPAYAIRPAQHAASSSSPAAASLTRPNGEYVPDDPSARPESMTHRGRHSYATSAVNGNGNVSSPRRIRRRKDPTPFNILVIGAKNSGKTSFISLLRHSLASQSSSSSPNNHTPHPSVQPESTTTGGSRAAFTSHYLETTMDGERIGVTIYDSAGLEKNIVDLQLREMAAFVESKFEETFAEEQKVVRSPGVKDTHIHCVFLVLDPVRLDANVAASSVQQKNGVNLSNVSGLDDDLDLQALRVLWGKTTVIPVISKADTLTIGHMAFLKRAVWDSVKAARLDPLEALELEDDMAEKDDEDSDNDEYEDTIEDPKHDSANVNQPNGADDLDNKDVNNDDEEEEDDEPSSNIPSLKPRLPTQHHKRHSSLSASIKSSPDDETPYIPMSILSPDPHEIPPFLTSMVNRARPNTKNTTSSTDLNGTATAPGSSTHNNNNGVKIGRRFAWGFADPYNPEHCDFPRLRDSVFSEWRVELRDLSKAKWYENWRTSRLKYVGTGFSPGGPGGAGMGMGRAVDTGTLPMSKQRVKGGVTPVGAVPLGGLRGSSREFGSSPPSGGGTVPRTVSTSAGGTGGRMIPSGSSPAVGGAAAAASSTSNGAF